MKRFKRNCYSYNNLSKPKTDGVDSHISEEDGDSFYFDITGNKEIIEQESLDNSQSVLNSSDIAGVVYVEDNPISRNNINLSLKTHDCNRDNALMYDGKSLIDLTGKIISTKNYKNLTIVDITNSDCEVTQTDSISKIRRKRNKLETTDNFQNYPFENQLKIDSCFDKSEQINIVDFVQIKHEYRNPSHLILDNCENIPQRHSNYKEEIEKKPISSTMIEQVNCNKITEDLEVEHNKFYNEKSVVLIKEELVEDTSQDKRRTNKYNKKFTSSILQKEKDENITHCYIDEEYSKRRKYNLGTRVSRKKKNKKIRSENINEKSNEQNYLATPCELSNYSTRVKKKKKKVKKIYCEDVITKEGPYCKEKLQIVSFSDKNMLDVTVKRKRKKKKIHLEKLDRSIDSSSGKNYEEKRRKHFDNWSVCHTSGMEKLNRQKEVRRKKKKKNIKDVDFDNGNTEVNSNGIQVEIVPSSDKKGSDDGTVKKKKNHNYSLFKKRKKKKAKNMYNEDDNKLQTEINSVTNKEILDLPVKNKKKKKKTHSEKFNAEETSDAHYKVEKKCREKIFNDDDKVINENCDGKLWGKPIDNVDMFGVTFKRKKKKNKMDPKKLDKSKNVYNKDNYEKEQGEQSHNGFKCFNSEMELNRQKSGIEDTFEISNNFSNVKKMKKKRKIQDNDYEDVNTQLDSNCNDEIQVDIVSSSNRDILNGKSLKKNKESQCEKLDSAVYLCNAEICNDLISLNKKEKKKAEDIYYQVAGNKKKDEEACSEKFDAVQSYDGYSEEIERKYNKNCNHENNSIVESCNRELLDKMIKNVGKLEDPQQLKSRIENNSNQTKIKKRKLKNIYCENDISDFQNLYKDMNETKRKKIKSEKLDASVSLCNIENFGATPCKKSTNILENYFDKSMDSKERKIIGGACELNSYFENYSKEKLKVIKQSDELIESKERNGIEDKCELNDYSGEHIKKKMKLKNIIHEDNSSKDEESFPFGEIEIADISDVTSAPKKHKRPLSKFAQKFKMENEKCEDLTIEAELPCLEDDVSGFCIEELNINLPFLVHPLHMYCSRPSKPKPEEIAAAQEANIKIKSGIFTAAEDNKIRENWHAFCKGHGLNVNPSYFFQFPKRMKMEQKLKFLQYIGHGLEDRLLYRVHYRFKKIFQSPLMKKGRFTKKEDEQILKYLASTRSKRPFKDLGQILNRTNLSIEKRYDYLTSPQKTRIKWTIDVVDKLVNYMLKITKSEDIDSLRDVKFTSKQWLKLSKKMGNISVGRIQRAWKVYIYPRLFSNDYVDLLKMKKKIIKILYKRNDTDWRSVNWEEIAAKFDGFTAQKIYMMFKLTVNFNAPEHVSKNLKDCVDYMKNIFLKESNLHTAHKFDKFIYKDGHVQYKSQK